MEKSSEPHPYDIYIGAMVYAYRSLRCMSRHKLGQAIGVSAKDIRNYECAKTLLSTARLEAIAEILDLKIDDFLPKI